MKTIFTEYIIIIWLLFFAALGSSQSEIGVYDDVSVTEFEKINDASPLGQKSWSLVPKEDTRQREDKKQEQEVELPEYNNNAAFDGGIILDIFAYLVIILLIIALVYLILSNVQTNPKVIEDVDLDNLENIEEVDVKTGYQSALEKQDFRMAIRMQFIKLLQYLNEHEMINWKNEKTNRDYKREIQNPTIKESFKNLSTIFERSWYGNREIDEIGFAEVDAMYESFFSTVGR